MSTTRKRPLGAALLAGGPREVARAGCAIAHFAARARGGTMRNSDRWKAGIAGGADAVEAANAERVAAIGTGLSR